MGSFTLRVVESEAVAANGPRGGNIVAGIVAANDGSGNGGGTFLAGS